MSASSGLSSSFFKSLFRLVAYVLWWHRFINSSRYTLQTPTFTATLNRHMAVLFECTFLSSCCRYSLLLSTLLSYAATAVTTTVLTHCRSCCCCHVILLSCHCAPCFWLYLVLTPVADFAVVASLFVPSCCHSTAAAIVITLSLRAVATTVAAVSSCWDFLFNLIMSATSGESLAFVSGGETFCLAS